MAEWQKTVIARSDKAGRMAKWQNRVKWQNAVRQNEIRGRPEMTSTPLRREGVNQMITHDA